MSEKTPPSAYGRLARANDALRERGGARFELRLQPDENEALKRLTARTGEKRAELVRRLIIEADANS